MVLLLLEPPFCLETKRLFSLIARKQFSSNPNKKYEKINVIDRDNW